MRNIPKLEGRWFVRQILLQPRSTTWDNCLMRQASFANLEYASKGRVTRQEKFPGEVEQVVSWVALLALIEPHAPRAKTGCPPFDVEVMLCIHFLQQWCGLADVAMEEALCDEQLYRHLAGLGGAARIRDGVSFLRFLHLLDRHDLAALILGAISGLLARRGLMLKQGAAVDARIIAAHPARPRTKIASEPRRCARPRRATSGTWDDQPQAKDARRAVPRSQVAQVAHIGADTDWGLLRPVTTTLGNPHDITEAHKLLHHGKEANVFADSSYYGARKRQPVSDAHPDVHWHVAKIPDKRRTLDKKKEADALTDELEHTKARIRSKVERWSIRLALSNVCSGMPRRDWGLAKNTAGVYMLFTPPNLWLARKRILQAAAG